MGPNDDGTDGNDGNDAKKKDPDAQSESFFFDLGAPLRPGDCLTRTPMRPCQIGFPSVALMARQSKSTRSA